MSVKSYSLNVPAAVGTGTEQDISDLGSLKLWQIATDTSSEFQIEVCPDLTAGTPVWCPVQELRFQGDIVLTADTPMSAVRVSRLSGSGGTTTIDVSGEELDARAGESVPTTFAADAAAADLVAETPFWVAPGSRTVSRIVGVPGDAVAADPTDYKVWTIARRDADGTNPVTVGTLSTATTTLAAAETVAFTLSGTPADLEVGDGQYLTKEQGIGGLGVQSPGILVDVILT